MTLFKKLFSNNKKITEKTFNNSNANGYIGLFNLEQWWNKEFSIQEQKYIMEKYGDAILYGKQYYNGSAPIFLSSLSSWFSTKKDLQIAKKLLLQAENLFVDSTPTVDKHFYYMHNIQIYYKDRENEESLRKAIYFCEKQISIAKIAKKYFLTEYSNQCLPSHTGYEQLAIIEEKRGNMINALNLSKQAKLEGWSNDWDKRILRLEKKLANNYDY